MSLFIVVSSSHAGPEIQAKQAILYDMTTNTVLFEKDADELVPPSSMTKIMTAYIIFDELKAGRLTLSDTFLVSEQAWRTGGSKMFVKVGDRVSIEDLLRGTIVQSGNDATVALAEGFAGSEGAFAEEMTRRAHELGATTATFKNASGLPAEGHVCSVRDLLKIAEATIKNFPDFYPYYKETKFTYSDIEQMNRNPLLYSMPEADGLKTGFTDAGGYGLVASAIQGNRRLVMVINGSPSMKQRALDAESLMRWGLTSFMSPKIYDAMAVAAEADVWMGDTVRVPLVVRDNLYVTIPRAQMRDLKVALVYNNPIQAPIKLGQELGYVEITLPDREPQRVPLLAGQEVARAGFFSRIGGALKYLFFGRSSS